MEPPFAFTDIQVRGPFKAFTHRHRFEAMAGGTRMTDEWEHSPPFGPFGRLADRWFLERHMRQLLEARNAALKLEAECS